MMFLLRRRTAVVVVAHSAEREQIIARVTEAEARVEALEVTLADLTSEAAAQTEHATQRPPRRSRKASSDAHAGGVHQ